MIRLFILSGTFAANVLSAREFIILNFWEVQFVYGGGSINLKWAVMVLEESMSKTSVGFILQ